MDFQKWLYRVSEYCFNRIMLVLDDCFIDHHYKSLYALKTPI
jgi:hypothetical protein